jgi:hypothetical protein
MEMALAKPAIHRRRSLPIPQATREEKPLPATRRKVARRAGAQPKIGARVNGRQSNQDGYGN